MKCVYNRIASTISRWPDKVLAVSFALIILFSIGLYRLAIDTSVDRVLPESHPLIQQLKDFKKSFVSDNKIIIGVKTEELFSQETIAYLNKLSSTLSGLPEVAKVIGIPTLKVPYGQDKQLSFKHALETDPDVLITHPLFQSTLISKDGRATLLQLYPAGEWPADFPNRLLSLLKNESDKKTEIYIAGVPVIEQEVIESIYHDLFFLPPIVALVLVIFLIFIWRDLVCTSLCLGAVLFTLTATFGVMGWCSVPVTVLTPVLPPLLMAATVAAAAHVLAALKQFGSADLPSVFERIFLPCLFAALTTAAGFGSLFFNPIIQVKEFGIFSMVGILISFFIVFGCLVPLSCLLKIKKEETRSYPFIELFLQRLNSHTSHYHRAIVVIFSSIMLVFFIFLLGLKADISIFDTLNHKGDVYKGYQFFQDNFSGVSTLELDLKNENGLITEPQVLTSMLTLAEELNTDPRVNMCISIADFTQYLNGLVSPQTQLSDQTAKGIGHLLFLYRLAGYGHIVDDYITRERDRARFTVMVKNISAEEFSTLSEKVKRLSRSIFPEGVTIKVTGTIEMYSQLNQHLLAGLIKSLCTAFILIGILLIIFLRSVPLGLISFFPNAFPLIIIYGTMRIFNLSIDAQSAMVGCVSLGISVDGTVHFLHHYQSTSTRIRLSDRIRQVWISTGIPVLIATLTLTATFAILTISSFRPIQIFGMLSVLGLISAIWADLVYLPALLFRGKKQ